jgi:hypothetical protein
MQRVNITWFKPMARHITGPKLAGSVRIGGIVRRTPHASGKTYAGSPQMVEISCDGNECTGLTSQGLRPRHAQAPGISRAEPLASWRNRLTSVHYDCSGTISPVPCGVATQAEVAAEAENAELRHHLIILRRRVRGRPRLQGRVRFSDRRVRRRLVEIIRRRETGKARQ